MKKKYLIDFGRAIIEGLKIATTGLAVLVGMGVWMLGPTYLVKWAGGPDSLQFVVMIFMGIWMLIAVSLFLSRNKLL